MSKYLITSIFAALVIAGCGSKESEHEIARGPDGKPLPASSTSGGSDAGNPDQEVTLPDNLSANSSSGGSEAPVKGEPVDPSSPFLGTYKPDPKGESLKELEALRQKAATGDENALMEVQRFEQTQLDLRADGTWQFNLGHGLIYIGTYKVASDGKLLLVAERAEGKVITAEEKEEQVFTYDPKAETLDAANNPKKDVLLKKVK